VSNLSKVEGYENQPDEVTVHETMHWSDAASISEHDVEIDSNLDIPNTAPPNKCRTFKELERTTILPLQYIHSDV